MTTPVLQVPVLLLSCDTCTLNVRIYSLDRTRTHTATERQDTVQTAALL